MAPVSGPEFGELLRQARRRHSPPLKQRQVAELAHVSASYPGMLESGLIQRPSETMVNAIARVFGYDDAEAMVAANTATVLSPDGAGGPATSLPDGGNRHFLTDSGDARAARSGRPVLPQMGVPPWSQGTLVLVAVPIVGRANMGDGGGPVEGQAIELPQIVLAGRNVLALEVYGSCMEPEYSPGDIVLVDQDIKPRDGDIVAAELPGSDEGPLVKRFYRHQTPEGIEIELRPNIVGAGVGTRIRRPEAEIRVHGVVYLHIRRISRGVVTTTHLHLVTDRVG